MHQSEIKCRQIFSRLLANQQKARDETWFPQVTCFQFNGGDPQSSGTLGVSSAVPGGAQMQTVLLCHDERILTPKVSVRPRKVELSGLLPVLSDTEAPEIPTRLKKFRHLSGGINFDSQNIGF